MLNLCPKLKPELSLNYLVGIDIPSHIQEEINYFFQDKLKSFKNGLDFQNLYDPKSPSDFNLIIGNRTENFVKILNGNSVYKNNE